MSVLTVGFCSRRNCRLRASGRQSGADPLRRHLEGLETGPDDEHTETSRNDNGRDHERRGSPIVAISVKPPRGSSLTEYDQRQEMAAASSHGTVAEEYSVDRNRRKSRENCEAPEQ